MVEYTVRVDDDGDKFWYLNKWWYLNGKRHREDGPAIEYANGYKEWWLNGKEVTEEEHKRRTSPIVEMTMEEISKALGKQVKVVE